MESICVLQGSVSPNSKRKLRPIRELSVQWWEFSSYTEDSFDKYLSGDLLYFFEIIDYGHVNTYCYWGDSHFCQEIPRNKLKCCFHMLLKSTISALRFHIMHHGNQLLLHLLKRSEMHFAQISVLILAQGQNFSLREKKQKQKTSIDGCSSMFNIRVQSIHLTRQSPCQKLISLSSEIPLPFSSPQLEWFPFDPSPASIYSCLLSIWKDRFVAWQFIPSLTFGAHSQNLHYDVFKSKNQCRWNLLSISHMRAPCPP